MTDSILARKMENAIQYMKDNNISGRLQPKIDNHMTLKAICLTIKIDDKLEFNNEYKIERIEEQEGNFLIQEIGKILNTIKNLNIHLEGDSNGTA